MSESDEAADAAEAGNKAWPLRQRAVVIVAGLGAVFAVTALAASFGSAGMQAVAPEPSVIGFSSSRRRGQPTITCGRRRRIFEIDTSTYTVTYELDETFEDPNTGEKCDNPSRRRRIFTDAQNIHRRRTYTFLLNSAPTYKNCDTATDLDEDGNECARIKLNSADASAVRQCPGCDTTAEDVTIQCYGRQIASVSCSCSMEGHNRRRTRGHCGGCDELCVAQAGDSIHAGATWACDQNSNTFPIEVQQPED